MTSNCPRPSLQGPPPSPALTGTGTAHGTPYTPSRPGQPLVPRTEERQAPLHCQDQCLTWGRKIVKQAFSAPFRVKPHPSRAWPPLPWPRRYGWGEGGPACWVGTQRSGVQMLQGRGGGSGGVGGSIFRLPGPSTPCRVPSNGALEGGGIRHPRNQVRGSGGPGVSTFWPLPGEQSCKQQGLTFLVLCTGHSQSSQSAPAPCPL